MTELWLSAAHRSQATSPGPAVLAPYSTPGSACGAAGSRGRSGEVNGNDAASAAVSMVRRSISCVGAGRQGGGPALQRAEGGGDGDQQQRGGQRPHRRGLGGEVVLGGGVDR